MPCLLNILGAVLFMRVGYVVGYAGLFGTIGLFGCRYPMYYYVLRFSNALLSSQQPCCHLDSLIIQCYCDQWENGRWRSLLYDFTFYGTCVSLFNSRTHSNHFGLSRFGGATGLLFYICCKPNLYSYCTIKIKSFVLDVINSAFNATAMVEDLLVAWIQYYFASVILFVQKTFLPEAPKYYFNIMYHGTLFLLLLIALVGSISS